MVGADADGADPVVVLVGVVHLLPVYPIPVAPEEDSIYTLPTLLPRVKHHVCNT